VSIYVNPSGACPDDAEETAERYLLRSLTPGATARFEEHYLACPHCAGVLSAAEDYVSAIRVACLRQSSPGTLNYR